MAPVGVFFTTVAADLRGSCFAVEQRSCRDRRMGFGAPGPCRTGHELLGCMGVDLEALWQDSQTNGTSCVGQHRVFTSVVCCAGTPVWEDLDVTPQRGGTVAGACVRILLGAVLRGGCSPVVGPVRDHGTYVAPW